jgi:hypothetical protein
MALQRRLKATVAKRPLLEALKSRYPKFTSDELEQLESLIVEAVANGIRTGKYVGLIGKSSSGEIELDALYVHDRAEQIVSRIGRG